MNRPLYGGMEEKMTREAVFETLNEVFRDVSMMKASVLQKTLHQMILKTGIPWSILIF